MTRVIYIHIPRTAGRSVKQSLQGYGDVAWQDSVNLAGHPTIGQAKEMLGDQFNEADFVFTVVRNPWSWRHSWYHWLRTCEPGGSGHPIAEKLCKTVPFREHLLVIRDLHGYPFFTRTKYGSSSFSLFKQCQVDYIDPSVRVLSYETLADDFQALFGRPITHYIGSSNSLNYRDSYDDETRGIVETIWKPDIEAFNYEF